MNKEPSLPALSFYHGIFRINSDISAGTQKLETIAELAENSGVDFLVVSDQFLVRAEYGLPPFRNLFSYSMQRKSISTYGIDKYLARIVKIDKAHPNLTVVPGADIAPAYYWTGNPFTSSLTSNQFSEQLTVLGPTDPDFYRKLPVIHNDQTGFFFPFTMIALLPLLLSVIGFMLFLKKKPVYKDRLGNEFKMPVWRGRNVIAVILIALGLMWTINNRPFTKPLGFDQYSPSNQKDYQQLFDYIDNCGKREMIGVFWSAPEATMHEKRSYASLLSVPFIDDLRYTQGYNGFAGVYGDVSHAYLPESFWDDVLLEYCKGGRRVRPVIIGERDWHGNIHGVPINFIKTVLVEEASRHSVSLPPGKIVDALNQGRSYALLRNNEREITLKNVFITASSDKDNVNAKFAIPGRILTLSGGNSVTFLLSGTLFGRFDSKKKYPAEVVVILDGEKIETELVDLKKFSIKREIKILSSELSLHYIRFYIQGKNGEMLACNPFFIKIEK